MNNKKIILISIIALVIINVMLYAKTTKYEFVNYDDPDYITNNSLIKDVDGAKLKKIFSETYFANYQPLVLISYAIDYKFNKLNARGYHITNILFHTMNSILALILLYLISGNVIISFIIALIFSVHPVQVESVAWLSERKGLICTFFYFLSFISYALFSRDDKKSLYYLSIVLFLMALLSKPMAITFPLILVLYDYYKEKLTKERLVEKIPFFVLAAIITIITLLTQQSDQAIDAERVSNVARNFIFAFYSVGFYIGKLILPRNLCAFYEYPDAFSINSTEGFIAIFVIVALGAYLINFKRIKKEVHFGMLFFLISLIPILRFVPLGATFAAERYLYFPMIGFFFAILTPLFSLTISRPKLKKVFTIAMILYVTLFARASYVRSDVWENTYKLWTDVLRTYPRSYMAVITLKERYYDSLIELGESYTKIEEYDRAREYYSLLLKYENIREEAKKRHIPEAAFDQVFPYARFEEVREIAYDRIGMTYLYENRLVESEKYFMMLAKSYPNNAKAFTELGNIYDLGGYPKEAEGFYKKSLLIDEKSAYSNYNYAMFLERHKRIDEATKYYELAVTYAPDWDLPRKYLARIIGKAP
ncbi:tetratricopeptide repeat protein [Thermodesulfobacteriota bacterium]